MGNQSSKRKVNDITKYYTLGDLLGSGSFGQVTEATNKKTGEKVAIKTIKKANLTQEALSSIQDEVDILRRVDHPGCVKMVEVYESPKTIYIVMELLTGGELFDRIAKQGTFTEQQASNIIRQIVYALKYLHHNGIVHRDLKPENLIYATSDSNSPVKITDFGLAKRKGANETLHTACGTPTYVAPEVLKKQSYTTAVDLWSVGVILYILLCGFPPFYHDETPQLYHLIRTGSYSFPDPYWAQISPEAKELVRGLLTVDPNKRYTCDQVLEHPWIATDVASARQLGEEHRARLRLLQAKRKLRRCVQVLIAANRFGGIIQQAAKDPNMVKKIHPVPSAGLASSQNNVDTDSPVAPSNP